MKNEIAEIDNKKLLRDGKLNNYVAEITKQDAVEEESVEVQNTNEWGINTDLGNNGKNALAQFLDTTGATVAQLAMIGWWGFERGAEGVVDLGATALAGFGSIGTSFYDLVTGNFGKPNSLTAKLYDDLGEFVKREWINESAENIYNTDFGKWVDQNSLFNHSGGVAEIGKGIGETLFVLATGEVIGGSSSISLGKNAGTISAAAVKGFGQGTERGLNLGYDNSSAIKYGLLSGGWEGLQFGIGMGINSTTNNLLKGAISPLQSTLIYGGSIAIDAADSGVEGIVQPLLQTLYNGKSFDETFKENGGWDNVLKQTALGAVMSTFGTAKEYNASLKKNGVDLKQQFKNPVKVIKGTGKTLFGGIGVAAGTTTGNPILTAGSLALLTDGSLDLAYASSKNYIQNSDFIVQKGGTNKINGKFKPDNISESPSMKGMIASRLEPNNSTYFEVQALNMFQQLKKSNNGVDITYHCNSQAKTKSLLKKLEKIGFIKDLTIEDNGKSHLAIEKFIMGGQDSTKLHNMYEMTFKLTDNAFDSSVAKQFTSKMDLSNYKQIDKIMDGKKITLYDFDISKALKGSIQDNGLGTTLKNLSGINNLIFNGIDAESGKIYLNSFDTAAVVSKNITSTTKNMILDLKTSFKNITSDIKNDFSFSNKKSKIDSSVDTIKIKDTQNIKSDVLEYKQSVSKLTELKTKYGYKLADLYSSKKSNPVLEAEIKDLEVKIKDAEAKVIDAEATYKFNEVIRNDVSIKKAADYLNSLTPEELIEYQKTKIKPENKQIIDNITTSLTSGIASDEVSIDFFKGMMNELLENGSDDAKKVVRNISKLKEIYPKFSVELSDSDYQNYSGAYFSPTTIDAGHTTTTGLHEFGHVLHALVGYDVTSSSQVDLPSNYDSIMKNAYEHALQNKDTLVRKFAVYDQFDDMVYNHVTNEVNVNLNKLSNEVEAGYVKFLSDKLAEKMKSYKSGDIEVIPLSQLSERVQNEYYDILNSNKFLKQLNITEETNASLHALRELKYVDSFDTYMKNLKNEMINDKINFYFMSPNSYYDEISGISEMACGVFSGREKTKAELNYNGSFMGHSDRYYEINPSGGFSEAVTEFTKLKFRNKFDTLNDIKTIFGDEYYNMLDSEYNKIMKNFDQKIEAFDSGKINNTNNNNINNNLNAANLSAMNIERLSNDSLYKISSFDEKVNYNTIDINKTKENMRQLGQSESEINQAILELERAKSLTGNMKQFDGNKLNVIYQMGSYFGDGGSKLNEYLMKGFTKDSILTWTSLSPNRKNYINFFDNTREGKYISRLTKDEINAINYYSKNSGSISEFLRKNVYKPNIEKTISNLDLALSKYGGLDTDMRLYRGTTIKCFSDQPYSYLFEGVNPNDVNKIYSILKSLEGEAFKDKSYLSTSPGIETSFVTREDMNIVFDIIAPKGTDGAYINQISRFYNSENEFLLARNTNLRILNISKEKINGQNKVVIKCIVSEEV